jgi:ABC-2 type transport system ATP-binding protein
MTGPDAGDVLVVRDLIKGYRGRPVLRGVSLTAAAGEVVCVVGPNGAGKTTLIECVEGIRRPDAGTVEILGHTPADGPWVYHALFGAQLQESSLPARLRVAEALELFAAFHADPLPVPELLERTGLTEQRRKPFGNLSGGLKRRVLLAVALIGRPPLVLLDEPTAGLDPHARLAIWRLLQEAAGSGAAIVFTTHDMAEAEEYADRLYLLEQGRTVLAGRPADLLREAGLVARLQVPDGGVPDGGEPPAREDGLAEWLRQVPGAVAVRVIEGSIYGFGDAGYPGRVLAQLEQARGGHGTLPPELAGRAIARMSVGPARVADLYLISTGAVYGRTG